MSSSPWISVSRSYASSSNAIRRPSGCVISAPSRSTVSSFRAATAALTCTRSSPASAIGASPALLAYVGEVAHERGGGGHRRAHEVGAAAGALAAFEVAVGRARATLPGFEDVGVHPEAHRAAGLPPLEARLREDAVEALGLGLALHR